jgi:hypothetical protein
VKAIQQSAAHHHLQQTLRRRKYPFVAREALQIRLEMGFLSQGNEELQPPARVTHQYLSREKGVLQILEETRAMLGLQYRMSRATLVARVAVAKVVGIQRTETWGKRSCRWALSWVEAVCHQEQPCVRRRLMTVGSLKYIRSTHHLRHLSGFQMLLSVSLM